jgi:DNA relaxase NicK
MHILKSAAIAAILACVSSTSMLAQESSYTPGSVWVSARIKTEPGQFENYLDWLNNDWKKRMEFMKREGVLLSYHVLQVNNARAGEPDLILVQEYRDYQTTAQQLAMDKKMDAMMAADARKNDTASGERKSMRSLLGSMEMQELKLR